MRAETPFCYMDFAATSAIRPPQVAEAVYRFLLDVGATPGRSGHRLAVEAGRVALSCRRAVAGILGLPGGPTRIAFHQNATHALNVALLGILRPGDVVVTSAYDHNSVLRPVHRLERERGVVARMIRGDAQGNLDPEELAAALDGARLFAVSAASNVLGTCLPLKALASAAHEAGALVLVDAAQWAGHFQGGLGDAGADLVAFTGHKGLLGPQGIGGLWVREGVEVEPLFSGGTGSASHSREMPGSYPDRLEAGSGNAPGMAGLRAGIEYLEREGVSVVHARAMELKAELRDGMSRLPGVRVLSPPAPDGVAIVTLEGRGVDPATLARRLDQEWGVMVRHGLNCAPEVHRLLGTGSSGAVRFSLGWSSTPEDVVRAVEAVDAITRPPSIPVG